MAHEFIKEIEEAKKLLKGVPKRLLAARKARGFETRAAFSSACKVPLATYLNHEGGRTELGVGHAIRYSKVLDISISWLLCGEGHPLGYLEGDLKYKSDTKNESFLLYIKYLSAKEKEELIIP